MTNQYEEFLKKQVEVLCDNGNRIVGIYEGLSYDDDDECNYVYVKCSTHGCYELKPEEIVSMKEL